MKRCVHYLQQPTKQGKFTAATHLKGVKSIVSAFRARRFQSRPYATVSASELRFGQPVHESHPHLLKPGEITRGISALEYAQRRSKLASRLPKNAVAILAASEVKYRSGAVFYEFRQESNFLYLTGFNEPEALAVIGKSTDEEDHIFHLYVRPKDPKAEQFDGARSGPDAARDVFNADETGDISQVDRILQSVVSDASEVYTDIPLKPESTSLLTRFLFNPSSKPGTLAKVLESSKVKPLKPIINDIRAFKSDAELANMRAAGRASGRAFTEAMRQCWTGEKELASFIENKFKKNGCDGSAYIPVVAGGKNALSIHYVWNNDVLRKGELVRVDASGEYGTYITDIARTFPISPTFTPAQADLYNAVLAVQRNCVSLCRANASISLDRLHDIAEQDLGDNLKGLGFDMSGNAIDVLFPHHLGHYIGLDVHDTPGYSRKENLKARQCVTIEPGIYVPYDDRWPAHFQGMGVQIEDSIAVQEEHPYVLTTEAVKEVVDIEALRS